LMLTAITTKGPRPTSHSGNIHPHLIGLLINFFSFFLVSYMGHRGSPRVAHRYRARVPTGRPLQVLWRSISSSIWGDAP
jgi:hypothetical protein